jgi:hypothetical protein
MRPERVDSGPITQRWVCPVCLMPGQTWLGNVRGTNLLAHLRVCHPERSHHPSYAHE